MGWFSTLFRRDTESRYGLAQLVSGAWDGSTSPTYANVTRPDTVDQALRLSTVWACVRLLADTVSTMPVDVYRTGSRETLPTPAVLESPAAGSTRAEWLYQCMVSLLLRGNAYGLVTARSGAAMRPSQVELVHPDLMSVTVTAEGAVEYRYRGRTLDKPDIWHVKAYPFPGSPTGLSPISYAAWSIGLGLAATRYAGEWFEQGAHPTGLLTTEGTINADQADRAKQSFIAATKGKREPVVLGQGLTYKAFQVTPEDSQLVDLARWTVGEIARVFGVPPEMVAGETGGNLTYVNTENRALDFLRYSMNPWLVRLEDALSRLLPNSQYVKFNADALLRPSTTERYNAHKIALDAGFMTINEVRELEDLPPLADAGQAPAVAVVA